MELFGDHANSFQAGGRRFESRTAYQIPKNNSSEEPWFPCVADSASSESNEVRFGANAQNR
jgi:hypothetical protein